MSQRILNDDSLTFAEKVISNRAQGNDRALHPGEITVVSADMAMAQDSTGPLAIKVFDEMGSGRFGIRQESTLSSTILIPRLMRRSQSFTF